MGLILRSILDSLAASIFPAPCRVCDETLGDARLLPICGPCLNSIGPLSGACCDVCGRPFASAAPLASPKALCHLCRRGLYAFHRARSFAAYHETLRAAIGLLKYEGVTPLGGWFARRLFGVFMDDPDRLEPDIVVPVPLHPDRLRERGYNQAEIIAKPLARRLGLPLASLLLVRTQPRPDKLLLSRRERWTTVRGAYATRQGARVDNRSVLLIDDVFTTGATLDACARVLRAAGAAGVYGLTVARTIPDWTPDRAVPDREGRETRTAPPAS